MESFDRIEKFIHDVNHCVAASRDLCQYVCQDLRQLLHQPWPPKERKLSKPTATPADEKAGNHGDGTSSEEAETLAKVERILAKAQRARALHGKLNPTGEGVAADEVDESETSQAADESPTPKPPTQVIDGQEFAVISASSLQKIFADAQPLSSGLLGRGKAPLAPIKPRPGTAKARAAYDAKLQRPRPAAKPQYRTSSSEIGRSLIAGKPRGKLASSRNSAPGVDRAGPKTQRTSGKIVGRPPTDPAALQGKPAAVNNRRPDSIPKTGGERHNAKPKPESQRRRSGGGAPVGEKESRVSPNDKAEKPAQKAAGLRLGEVTSHKQGGSGESNDGGGDVPEEGPFMLRKDGADLKVPVKLKRLHADISKLRQKLTMLSASDRASGPSQHFLRRLEAKIHPVSSSSSSPSPEELQDCIDEQAARCRHLIQVTDAAVRSCQHADSSWESRYRTKVLAKALRTNLEELRLETGSILAGERKRPSGGSLRPASTMPPSPSRCISCEGRSANPSTAIFLPAHEGLATRAFSLQPTSCDYHYSNLQELQQLTALQHDAQQLAIQIHLEKLIGSEMIPILEATDPTDASFIPLYRSLYGLLCHGGQLYPSIVGDSIGNDSTLEPS